MQKLKRPLLYGLSGLLCTIGFLHLLRPGPFVAIIPPGLPSPEWLNLLAGLFEIVLGVFLLEARVRWLAAWGVVALLIAVFPANVYMAEANIGRDLQPGSGHPWINWGRLPLQLVFVAWAWWYTRPDVPSG